MTNYKTAFPSRYLKPEDLGTARPIVPIKRVEFADFGTGADVTRKLVVTFDADDITFATPVNVKDDAIALEALNTKGWVLNRINSETIADICQSDDIEQWVGHRIELYVVKVEFQGKRVPGIRCAAPTPAPKPTKKPTGTRPTPPVVHPPSSAARETDLADDVPF